MISAAKAKAKRHWPKLRLRTILLATLVFVAALPGVAAMFLRVYENTLVRQTEAELIAQGAALVAAGQASWPGAVPSPQRRSTRPEEPQIDLNASSILPPLPPPRRRETKPDPEALAAARMLEPVIASTAQITFAEMQLIDRNGTVLSGRLARLSYAHVPEVAGALKGRVRTVLRHNGAYQRRYPLEWLSRASDILIHHARPVRVDGQVVGVLLLSRSPRALFRGIYEDKGKIMIGIGLIFATLVLLSGLLSRGIAKPIEELSVATKGLALGKGELPAPPPTAAIEIQSLYADFAAMAEAIDRRSRYLRDFAHAVSHEFKTPLAGIRGGIELLEDHHGTMEEKDRRRFLANMAADADRLAQLVSKLLELARADMARPEQGESTSETELRAILADGAAIEVDAALPKALPPLAVPPATLRAVLTSLLQNSIQAGASRVLASGKVKDGWLSLELADDGPGIAEADRARVFEPFFTSRRSSGGTGLGLPIARSLLEASLASIELLPSNEGARFRLSLPLLSRIR
jgi:signal transduction histidine kinase